jgi:hypothetical protein
VHIFGRKEALVEGDVQAQIRGKLDNALTSIFTEDGKKTVLYYMTEKYSLTLEQASHDPARLEQALTSMLGEIGWMVVKKRILEQFYGKTERGIMVPLEAASLRDAFGSVGSLLSMVNPGLPRP